MKLFKTGNIDVVKGCQNCFVIDLPSCAFIKRQDKFILQYNFTVNIFANFVVICNIYSFIVFVVLKKNSL